MWCRDLEYKDERLRFDSCWKRKPNECPEPGSQMKEPDESNDPYKQQLHKCSVEEV